jgi:hypothetical protein
VPTGAVRSLITCALAGLAAVVPAGALAARPATTGPDGVATVHVKLTAQRMTLSRVRLRLGDTGRFVVRNMTTGRRIFTVGGTSTRPIAPGAQRILLIGFNFRGDYPIRATGPGAAVQRANFRIV